MFPRRGEAASRAPTTARQTPTSRIQVQLPQPAEWHEADAALAARIQRVHADSDGAYGASRIAAELREDGLAVNEKRVARVMRKFGIVAPICAGGSGPPCPNRRPDFSAPAPNLKYMGGVTYLPAGGGRRWLVDR